MWGPRLLLQWGAGKQPPVSPGGSWQDTVDVSTDGCQVEQQVKCLVSLHFRCACARHCSFCTFSTFIWGLQSTFAGKADMSVSTGWMACAVLDDSGEALYIKGEGLDLPKSSTEDSFEVLPECPVVTGCVENGHKNREPPSWTASVQKHVFHSQESGCLENM